MNLLLAAVAASALFVWFLSLEARRRPDVAVLLVVGVTVLDALLYPSQADVPLGPFRPVVGGQDLRLVDLLVPLALSARLLVRGLPRRISGEGLAWSLFFAWYAYAGFVGLTRDQPIDLVLFQAKFIVETGGMVALVGGVALGRLADPRLLTRVSVIGGAVAAVLVPLASAGVSLDVPVLERAQLGRIAPDAATILFTLGVLTLVGSSHAPLRWPVVLGSIVLLATPFVADQRAALVGTVGPVLVVAAAMGGKVWRRRSPLRIAALVPAVALLLVPIGIASARAASSGEGVESAPFVERLSATFGSEQKQASADIRVGLLRQGGRLARDRPVLGQGLGQPVAILTGGTGTVTMIGDFHNVAVDLAVRTGLSGLTLFGIAVVTSLLAAGRRWAHLVAHAHACLVLAAAAALTGLLVKGMFETIFQKYRLAMLLGLLLGVLASAGSARTTPTTAESPRRELQWT